MKIYFLIFFLCTTFFLSAHDGHELSNRAFWIWIGSFHLIFLHFPISLIYLLVLSELFSIVRPKFTPSRFLAISLAVTSPLAALLGLVYWLSTTYEGDLKTLIFWHMWLGIISSFLALLLPFLQNNKKKFYYLTLFILFFFINSTGFFGGTTTFPSFHLLP